MTRRFIAAVLSLVFVMMAGCTKPNPGGPTSGDGKPVEGGTLNLSMYSAPKGVFNPILYEDNYDSKVIGLVFNGLLRNNEKLEFICDLCESFVVSEDNKTVTFKLRRDVKWHDGVPFTAEDVAFTFRTILHPDYTGVRTGQYSALAGAQKMLDTREDLAKQVEEKKLSETDAAKKKADDWQAWLNGDGKKAINVIDQYTISFTTDEPYAPLVENLSMSIIPSHVYKDVEVAKMIDHPSVKHPIGTGPYKFVEYKTDQYVELARYEGYHMGKPNIAKVIYKIVNQDVAIGQLKSSELDYVQIKPSDVDLVQGDKNIRIEEIPDFGYQFLGLNHDRPLFSDKRVRQAMMYGINRQEIVNKLLKGHGTVVNGHIPPILWANDPSALNPYPYDVQKAKSLLEAAGWKSKNADGYLVKDGKVFEFTLLYPSGNKTREASAPLIQANLKELGIKVNLQMMEFATLSTTVFDKRDMDAWLMGWSTGLDPDPGPIFMPDNKWGKVTGWNTPDSERLIKSGTRVLKISERKPIYVEWSKLINDQLPYLFLYTQNDIEAVRTDRVSGLKPDARGALWNIWELWIPKGKQGA